MAILGNIRINPLATSIFVISTSMIVVFLLHAFSEKPNGRKNGFLRIFLPMELTYKNSLKHESPIFEISGFVNSDLYYQDANPAKLHIINLNLSDQRNILLKIPSSQDIARLFYTLVDSQSIFVLAGNARYVFHSSQTRDSIITDTMPFVFDRGIVLSKNTLILRGYDTGFPNRILIKAELINDPMSQKWIMPEYNNDGGFTNDGQIHYDFNTNSLVYVMYYRNRFYCLDSSLTFKFQGFTIDTSNSYRASAVPTKSKNTKKGRSYTMASPPKFVNKASCVYNGKLYVNSNLKADNESIINFRSSSIIDIYDLTNGKYEGSFYIPSYENQKARHFRIFENILYAIYGHYLVSYQLPSKSVLQK